VLYKQAFGVKSFKFMDYELFVIRQYKTISIPFFGSASFVVIQFSKLETKSEEINHNSMWKLNENNQIAKLR